MTIGNRSRFPQLVGLTTGIGSLPHHNADAAIEFAFSFGIPFLPQIPIRNASEYMIPQALEGLPGLNVDLESGAASLDLVRWKLEAPDLAQRLDRAFANLQDRTAFEGFEPSAEAASCWKPFLWELGERKLKFAKIQIAGPLTCQWVLQIEDGSKVEAHPELGMQIMRLVLARALAMTRALQKQGVQPLIYVDEPGLYAFQGSNPKHVLALQELRLVLQALSHEGALVGLHCCSDTDWKRVLELPLDVLSLDTHLSLSRLMAQPSDLEAYLRRGGRLSLGVIPTSGESSPREDARTLLGWLETRSPLAQTARALLTWALGDALLTPACGLALASVPESQSVQARLLQFARHWREHFSRAQPEQTL